MRDDETTEGAVTRPAGSGPERQRDLEVAALTAANLLDHRATRLVWASLALRSLCILLSLGLILGSALLLAGHAAALAWMIWTGPALSIVAIGWAALAPDTAALRARESAAGLRRIAQDARHAQSGMIEELARRVMRLQSGHSVA
ncbi:MAG: hypothetical protein K2X74_04840 [Acetobacteraceae bacterium]|nr:hypothetical protein [Acetobacteraceae bacterium]